MQIIFIYWKRGMKVIFLYYIQECDKPNFILKLFNVIQLQQDKIILPIGGEKITSKKAQRLAKKTKKILDKAIGRKIVVSEEIEKQEEYVNFLHTYSIEKMEGRWLFEVLSSQILDYAVEKKGRKKEETQVSILINDLTEIMLSNIRRIAKVYKRVNIITNHIEKFKKIEKQILEKDGIMITVGNNKKKGLSKIPFILNVDFPTEVMNQYNIYEQAVILNVKGNVKITKKRFNGININDYAITFEKEDFDYDQQTKYKTYKIYEAQINRQQPFSGIMKQLEKDKVKITKLIGVNINI